MPDKTLTVLVLAAVAFSAAHYLDHLLRDDFSQPGAWAIAAAFLSAKYALPPATRCLSTSAARSARRSGRSSAFSAAVALWFAHLSPAAEQRPPDIYAMYGGLIAGLIASGLVYAMMLSLVALALYGG